MVMTKKLLLMYDKLAVRQLQVTSKGGHSTNDNNSLAHTSWNCKYHIVFAPKYRRQVYACVDTAEVQRVTNNGISERQKQFDDI